MLPVDFKYRLMYLGKPATMTDEECSSLPVWHDGESYVSCWKLNLEELKQIQETGTLYIQVFGVGHPPICPTAECPVQGEFNIKAGHHVTAKFKNPFDGGLHPINGYIVEQEGTFYIDTDQGFVLLACCKEIFYTNA